MNVLRACGGARVVCAVCHGIVVYIVYHKRRRWGGGQGGTCPPKIREKIFFGNYYIKFGHFSGKNHVKFGNFVNFSGKYHKNSGILIIFRARIM